LASYTHWFLKVTKFLKHKNKSCIFRTKNEPKNGLVVKTTLLLNFKNYEINGRFVTNLEPHFKIEHGRMKEHKKKLTIRIINWKMIEIWVQNVYSSGWQNRDHKEVITHVSTALTIIPYLITFWLFDLDHPWFGNFCKFNSESSSVFEYTTHI